MQSKVLLSRPFVGKEAMRGPVVERNGWLGGVSVCFGECFFFVFWDPAREVGKVGPKVKEVVLMTTLMTTVLGDAYFNRSVLRTRQSDA